MSQVKRTPLYEIHRALGAKMIPFGGWDMPVQYSGIIAEHNATREAAGLFDVSHMGEIFITGEPKVVLDFWNRSLATRSLLFPIFRFNTTLS